MIKRHRQLGFTLLEIMVAVSILAMALLAIMDFHSGAMLASRRAEDVTSATMLARLKMQELRLELERDVAKGEMPAESKTMEGSFDEPYERYSWVAEIKKVELPVPPVPEGEEGEEVGVDIMLKIFQIIAEKISESAREINLSVKWDELGEEQSISVATHIVRL